MKCVQIDRYDRYKQTLMGKKIENYILENPIGEGQFGKVYRATNDRNGQTVAIKIIKVEKFKMSPKLEEFTINEIQTLSKIEDTSHVVRFIEILKTANNYYFVYEFCNGGTLQQEIKKQGKFMEDRAVSYFLDLLKAFQILVKSNIMHRDIKPSNILLHNGVIKLADFGFCKPLKDARDLSQTMLGSPIYMAPEILKGQVYTIKADIWSLGVVLYQMLYGFCPFEEKTIARLISLIDEHTVTFPSNVKVSKRVIELMRKMLVKDHFKRIGWQELFAYELAEPAQEERTPPKYTSTAGSNPFSKKTTFTSIITEEVRNRYLNVPESYAKADLKNNSNTYEMKKKEPAKPQLSSADQKALQRCVQRRSKLSKGLKLLFKLLNDNSSSKLTVSIGAMLAKRLRQYNKETGQTLKMMTGDKQNRQNPEVKKLVTILSEEKSGVEEKLAVFESEYEQVKDPQDILLLRWAQQERMTQERDSLMCLVEVYDWLGENKGIECQGMTRKELLEQYQRHIIKNR